MFAQVFLALATVALGAVGWASPANAPVWFALAGLSGLLALLQWQRVRVARGLAGLGVRLGGQDAVARFVPVAASTDPAEEGVPAQARREEVRATVRAVRDSLLEAMTMAQHDREHGVQSAHDAAILAANRAALEVHELEDGEARALVGAWKVAFDAIPKGWKEGSIIDVFADEHEPLGYPEPAWTNLRRSADSAGARLGVILREMA